MTIVSIREAKNRLTEPDGCIEAGERMVVTCKGRPVLDLVPHRAPARTRCSDGGEADLRARGIANPITVIAEDADAPPGKGVLL